MIAVVYGVVFLSIQFGLPWLAIIIYLVFFIVVIPLALVGTLKYRASRSSWRGIHFSYNGTVSSMTKVLLKGLFFTLITFGFYGYWLMIDVYEEIAENLTWGNIKFKFTGKGGELFGLTMVGILLSYITLGIYMFKFMSNRHNFMVNNARMIQGDRKGTFFSHTTGMKYFKLLGGNMLILVLTLGIGFPWAMVRQMKFWAENTQVKGRIDFDALEQGNIDTTGAAGEGFFDAMDFQLV